jgi:hypothetical protein
MEVLDMAKRSSIATFVNHRYEARPSGREDRIGDQIKPQANGCWHFTGTRNRAGYGTVWTGSDTMLAHRYVYDMLVDDGIPEGLDLHHECGVKICVNPAHLTPLTRSEHSRTHGRQRLAERASQFVLAVSDSR